MFKNLLGDFSPTSNSFHGRDSHTTSDEEKMCIAQREATGNFHSFLNIAYRGQ